MSLSQQQIAAALDAINESIGKANTNYANHIRYGDPWGEENARWNIHLAYSQMLVFCEAMGLPALRQEIAGTLHDAEAAEGGLLEETQDPDGDPHLEWLGPARRYHRSLQSVFLTESEQTVTKDLEAVLRATTYAITNEKVYGYSPREEADVHQRIESILRCLWSDVMTKPPLAKHVKSFEPDTGIPSISTLIEYKFISNRVMCGAVADQILADTQGYKSKDWRSIVFVIYETERFRPEAEWRNLLRQCADPSISTSAIVLTGNATDKGRRLSNSAVPRKKGADEPVA